MFCTECGAKMDTKDTRPRVDGTIRRRHICPSCGKRMSTLEAPLSMVVMRASHKTKLVERLVHHLGYRSDLTGKTYNTKQEALDATMMELNNILTQEKEEDND